MPIYIQKPACDYCGKVCATTHYTGWCTDPSDDVWLCEDCHGIACDEE